MVAEQEFRTTTPEPASSAQRQSATQSEAAAPATTVSNNDKALKRCWRNATLVTQFGKEDTAAKSQSHAARIQDTVENAEVTEIKCAVFRALTRLKSYRDEGIRRD